jgi:hypothetical protein
MRPTILPPTFKNSPLFCENQPSFHLGKINDVAWTVAAEIHSVDHLGEFSSEAQTHSRRNSCNPPSHVGECRTEEELKALPAWPMNNPTRPDNTVALHEVDKEA